MTLRNDRIERTVSKINEDSKDIHISGEPDIGKTAFFNNVISYLQDQQVSSIIEITARSHIGVSEIYQDILYAIRDESSIIEKSKNAGTGFSLSAGGLGGGVSFDTRSRALRKIEELVDDNERPYIIAIDDIHKISELDEEVTDIIGELSSVLPENASLLTAGQISGVDTTISGLEEIHLTYFTRNQTKEFLEVKFDDLTGDDVDDIHTVTDGHPLYLEIVSKAGENFELTETEIQETIEENYIDSLSREEKEFLQKVSALPDIEPVVCGEILENSTPAEIEDLLRDLESKSIVQPVNRSESGYQIYKIHEIFRSTLHNRLRRREQLHREAFQAHMELFLEKQSQEEEVIDSFEAGFHHFLGGKYHLSNIYEEVDANAFLSELEAMDLSNPAFMYIAGFAGISIAPDDAGEILEKIYTVFETWTESLEELNPIHREVSRSLLKWLVSKFDNSIEPFPLTEIEVNEIQEDIDDLPDPEDTLDIEEDQAERLRRARNNMFKALIEEEPYKIAEYWELADNTIGLFGIDSSILEDCIMASHEVLQSSDLDDELENQIKQFALKLDSKFKEIPRSSIDFREMADIAIEIQQDIIHTFHREAIIESGILTELALEGGGELERAENPLFPMIWYGVFAIYLKNSEYEVENEDTLVKKYEE